MSFRKKWLTDSDSGQGSDFSYKANDFDAGLNDAVVITAASDTGSNGHSTDIGGDSIAIVQLTGHEAFQLDTAFGSAGNLGSITDFSPPNNISESMVLTQPAASDLASPAPIPIDVPDDGDTAEFAGTSSYVDPATPVASNIILATTIDQSGYIPPDPNGAAGPNNLVNTTNGLIQWYSKSGTLQHSETIHDFFGMNTGGSDPKVIYDDHAGRFVAMVQELQGLNTGTASDDVSRMYVAVSIDNNPNDGWYKFSFDSKIQVNGVNYWADYPGLAVDDSAVYLTTNYFQFEGSGSATSRLWIIPKAGFYDGGTPTATLTNPNASTGFGFDLFTLQPAQVYGDINGAVTGTFLVSTNIGFNNGDEAVAVVRVDNPTTTPTFAAQVLDAGDISPGSFTPPPGASQPGTTALIDAGDSRTYNAVWMNNHLYFANTINLGDGQDTAHWYDLDTSNLASITLSQQGNITGEDIAPGTNTYYPSVAVNSSGTIGIGFAASGPSVYAGSYYTVHDSGDAPGTVQDSQVLVAGQDSYERYDTNGRDRWGDLSTIALDPSDNQSFWVYNEYALPRNGTSGRWGTAYGKVAFNGSPTQPDLIATNAALSGATFTYRIDNVGTDTAAASTTGIYLSSDSTIDTNDSLLTTNATPSLAAGAHDDEAVSLLSLTLPSNLTPGTYYLGAVADYNNQIAESDDTNNASSGVPIILGNNDDNTLTGTAGDDLILGLSGNDTLNGGTGDDTLIGGDGNDWLYGDGGNDTLTGNAGNDVLLDRYDGFGVVTMAGGTGDDIYYVANIHDVLTEKPNEGLDSVVSSVDGWHLGTNFENLWLTHGATVGYGNDANNVILANPTLGSTLHGGLGDDRLVGGSGNDWLYGDGGNDTLTGNAGNDVLLDRFDGFGVVTMAGGTGDDIYYVANIHDVLTEKPNEGLDSVVSSVDGWHLGTNFENLWLTHGATVGYGNDANNVILANPTLGSTLHGGLGDDRLVGGSGNDWLYGDGGNDTLTGNAGNDVLLDRYDGSGVVTMAGGTGNDIYYVDNVHDVLTEKPNEGLDSVVSSVDGWHLGTNFENLWLIHGATVGYGNDANNVILANPTLGSTLHGGLGDDRLVGGSGNDWLYGEGGNDTLTGNAGNDVLLDRYDGSGVVTMAGGTGNDIYYVDNIRDVLTEKPNEGLDSVVSSVNSWNLGADFENLWLIHGATVGYGNDGNNVMLANPSLGSSLYGMGGDDKFVGGSGNDVLSGGDGNDTLSGAGGSDTFVFDTALNASTNVDRITDFTPGTDTIQLAHAVFATLPAGVLADAAFYIGAAAHDANDRVVYNPATGALSYDSDGTGAAANVHFATLATGLSLTHWDFVVV